MPVMKAGPGRALLGGGGNYNDLVMGTGPIAYWPQSETSGTVAHCLVNPAQNGTYSSDVSLWTPGTGIGDGNTAPKFDGAATFIDMFSAAFAAAFNHSEGSAMIWAKVDGAGVWTDATARYAWTVRRNVDNRMFVFKSATNNTLSSLHEGATVMKTATAAGHSETVWTPWGMTWSVTGGTIIQYTGGAWDAESVAGVTAWAGAPTAAYIGGYAGPTVVFDGWLSHLMLWDRVLAATEFAALAVVP